MQQTAVPISFLFPFKSIDGQCLILSLADLPNALLSYCFKHFLSILARFCVILSVFLHKATTNAGLLCPQHSLWERKAARLEACSPKLESEFIMRPALVSEVAHLGMSLHQKCGPHGPRQWGQNCWSQCSFSLWIFWRKLTSWDSSSKRAGIPLKTLATKDPICSDIHAKFHLELDRSEAPDGICQLLNTLLSPLLSNWAARIR